MSLLDKIKAFFAGDTTAASHGHDHDHDHDHDHSGHDHADHDHADHDHDRGSSYLQSPTDPDEPVLTPTPEEIAAASQAEPPTTIVEALSEDDRSDESR